MKIMVTGSLGHISKPLTEELVQKQHQVAVISSSANKQNDIEALRATAAIGSVEDIDFLTATYHAIHRICSFESQVKCRGINDIDNTSCFDKRMRSV